MRGLLSSSTAALLLAAQAAAQSLSAPSNPCGQCQSQQPSYYIGVWKSTTAESIIEAVTVLVLTDSIAHTARTTTIYNVQIPSGLSGLQVLPTNTDGTVVYTKTLTWSSETITTVLTLPTGYLAYTDGVSVNGQVPVQSTTTLTSPTPTTSVFINTADPSCTSYESNYLSLFPTIHSPVFPDNAVPRSASAYKPADYFLWSFDDEGTNTKGETDDIVCYGYDIFGNNSYQSIYPDFVPLVYCGLATSVCPEQGLNKALYLTVTKTSADPDAPTTSPSTPASTPASTSESSAPPAQSQIQPSSTSPTPQPAPTTTTSATQAPPPPPAPPASSTAEPPATSTTASEAPAPPPAGTTAATQAPAPPLAGTTAATQAPAQPPAAGEPAQSSAAGEPAQSANPQEPTQPAASGEPAQPAASGEPAQPANPEETSSPTGAGESPAPGAPTEGATTSGGLGEFITSGLGGGEGATPTEVGTGGSGSSSTTSSPFQEVTTNAASSLREVDCVAAALGVVALVAGAVAL